MRFSVSLMLIPLISLVSLTLNEDTFIHIQCTSEMEYLTILVFCPGTANSISGTLPSIFGKDITWLSLYGNWFVGTLPTSLGLLTDMIAFQASYNSFTGKSV